MTASTSPPATNETSSPRGSISKDNPAAEQTDICQGLSGKWALIYVALFAVALTAIVIANRISLATVNDTLLLLHSFEMLQRFSSLWSNDNSNPLQAMFDIFPSGLRLDTINNLIARALFGPGVHVVFFYVTSGLLLTGAAAALARNIGMRWQEAIVAGIILPLSVLPIRGLYPLGDHFYILWPIAYYAVAGIVFVTALFWNIRAEPLSRSILLTLAIAAILLHLSIIQILHMTLLAPAVLAMGIGAMFAGTAKDAIAKAVSGLAVTLLLGAAGIFHYLYATGINTASHVFFIELPVFMNYSPPVWSVFLDDIQQVFLNPFSHSFSNRQSIDFVIAPLAQLGAVYLSIFGRTKDIRIFARTLIVWIVLTALTVAFLHNFYFYTGHAYQGPDPRHFVRILWPFYIICLVATFFALVDTISLLLDRYRPGLRDLKNYLPHIIVIVVLLAPVALLLPNRLLAQPRYPGLPGVAPFPFYQPIPLSDFLVREIGIELDREFRGTMVFMPSDYYRNEKPYHGGRRESTFAYLRAYLANDIGGFAAKHFNIPTLDEFTHNITPQFYLTTRELLTNPGADQYDRHFASITRPNEAILALFGVRYVVADYHLPIGKEVFAMELPVPARAAMASSKLLKSPVRLFELSEPNVGNYSPTKQIRARQARDAIHALSDPGFNGRETFVSDHEISGDLVKAENAKMTVRRGGISISASSSGSSVLILPIQFSHCWHITEGSQAQLFRANLTQLGIQFSGELRAELRQTFGPFWQSACRIADAADNKRLDLPGGLGAAENRNRIAGDGENLLAISEALDSAVGNSPIASIRPAQSAGPTKEFVIAAEGGRTEHYVAFSVPKLAPGTYTLSLQVRHRSASVLSLQLNDGANGAIAEYWLGPSRAVVTRIGESAKRYADIRRVDDDWYALSLTTDLSGDSGRIYVHLRDYKGRGVFRARGQTLTVRAVKLERGEVATPYIEARSSN